VFTAGPAAEVLASEQNLGSLDVRLMQAKTVDGFTLVQWFAGVANVRVPPVVEGILSKASARQGCHVLLGQDSVGVYVGAVQRNQARAHGSKRCLHAASQLRISTRWPAIAAAAAMAGLIRCVRPKAPCLPSKLRLEVEAQRSPGFRRSSFMPRHMEQPGSRHSKPACVNIWSRPSCSA